MKIIDWRLFLKMVLGMFIGSCAVVALALAWVGCSGKSSSRYYGGASVVVLRPGERVVGASWRDTSLWLLTRPARAGEEPAEHVFREVSRMGWLEGSVAIKER